MLAFSAIPKGINLKRLNVLKKLELSTLVVRDLPSVIRTVTTSKLESIRFFVLVHQLENAIGDPRIRQSWSKLDLELCALADRFMVARRYGSQALQVKFVDFDPTTTVSEVEEVTRLFLPMSQQHSYMSLSIG